MNGTRTQRSTRQLNPFVALPTGVRIGYVVFQALYLAALLAAAPSAGNDPERYWIAIAVFGSSLIAGAPVVFGSSMYGWFHPLVFPAFYGLFAQLRAYPVYAFGLTHHFAIPGATPAELDGLLLVSVALSTVATLSFFAGYLLCQTTHVPHVDERARGGLELRILVVVGVTLTLFAVFLRMRGGLGAHVASWSGGRAVSMSGEYYWVMVMRTASVAVILWIAHRPKALRNLFFWCAAGVAMILSFAMTGARSGVLFYFASGFMVWMLLKREVPMSRLVLVAVGFILLIGSLGSFRDALRSGGLEARSESDLTLAETWERSVDEMRTRSGVIRGDLAVYGNVPERADFLYGRSYLALLTLAVPRGWWANKPMVIEAMVGRRLFGVVAGVPPGGVAEAYWNFHVVGVIIVYFLFGGFSRWLALLYVRNSRAPLVIALYPYTLLVLAPTGTSIVGWGLGMVPLILVGILVSRIRIRWRTRPHVRRGALVLSEQ